MTNAVTRLEGGLTTLEKAQEDTKVLGDELQIQSAEIAEKREKVEIIIQDVNQNTEIAGKEQKVAEALKLQISEQDVIIKKEEQEATEALKAAEPALAAAQNALKKLKADDLTELKAYNTVNFNIEITCGIAFLFYDRAALNA
jgi:dynein heavy chain